jgi:hypothetical protein
MDLVGILFNMKGLIISSGDVDYLQVSIILGLKDILGTDVEDINHHHYLYQNSGVDTNNIWGKGFSYTNILNPKLYKPATELQEKINSNYYDFFIFTSISRNYSLLETILEKTNGKNVFLLNGEDLPERLEFYNDKCLYFKRELNYKKYKNLYPINFSLHESKFWEKEVIKSQEISDSIPSMNNLTPISSSKYIFNNEQDYYNNYQKSKFGLTMKKAGWDSMRHYEILANKCLPIFENISQCPEFTLNKLPKKMLVDIEKNYKKMSNNNYKELSNEIFEYSKINLTTRANAQYLLNFII